MSGNRIIGIISAIALFSIFFLWALDGKFWVVLTSFYPYFHLFYLITALSLVLLLRGKVKKQLQRTYNFIREFKFIIFPSLGFILPLLISIFIFEKVPHIIDAAHYHWIGSLLLNGKLSIPLPDMYEFYHSVFNAKDTESYYSLFLPGYSLFLAPFILLGIPYIFGPLVTAISVFLIGKIAESEGSSDISVLSMFFASFSTFYMFMGASFMAHPFTLMLTLLSLYLFLIKNKKKKYLLLSGISLAYILLIRPQNAIYAYIPLAALLIIKQKSLKNLTIFTVPFLFFGLLLLFYNDSFTDNPLIFPQDHYFSIREPVEFCHRPGLGKGCPNTEGAFLTKEGFTISQAFEGGFKKLNLLVFKMTTHPYFFIFLVLIFYRNWKKYALFLSIFLVHFTGYFFFYIGSNLFGPRYLFEVSSMLLIPASAGFFDLFYRTQEKLKPLLIALPISSLLFLIFFLAKPLIKTYSYDKIQATPATLRKIEKSGIKNSVFFIGYLHSSLFLSIMENPPHDINGNLILKDIGKPTEYATAYYLSKGYKAAYGFDYNFNVPEEEPAIYKIENYDPDKMTIFPIYKFKPLTGKPYYGAILHHLKNDIYFPVKIDLGFHFESIYGYGVLFKELTPSSYYDFSHPIINQGRYKMKMKILAAKCGSDFILEVNGQKKKFSTYRKHQHFLTVENEFNLVEGKNYFKFTPLKNNSCIIFDKIDMERLK